MKFSTSMLLLTICVIFFSGCASVQCTANDNNQDSEKSSDASPAEQAPRDAKWTLALEDKFERDTLGANWKVLNGKLAIVDGQLSGNGILITTNAYPGQSAVTGEFDTGFQRIEFDIITTHDAADLASFIHSAPLAVDSNLQSILETGYLFQFGAKNNTLNRISKSGNILWEEQDPKTLIEPPKKYRLVCENDEGTVRFYINGQKLYEQKEKFSVVGPGYDHAGLYLITDAKVDNLQLFIKRQVNQYDRD